MRYTTKDFDPAPVNSSSLIIDALEHMLEEVDVYDQDFKRRISSLLLVYAPDVDLGQVCSIHRETTLSQSPKESDVLFRSDTDHASGDILHKNLTDDVYITLARSIFNDVIRRIMVATTKIDCAPAVFCCEENMASIVPELEKANDLIADISGIGSVHAPSSKSFLNGVAVDLVGYLLMVRNKASVERLFDSVFQDLKQRMAQVMTHMNPTSSIAENTPHKINPITPREDLVAQIEQMGFSHNGAKRAVTATRNASVKDALRWAIEHSLDKDFDEPFIASNDTHRNPTLKAAVLIPQFPSTNRIRHDGGMSYTQKVRRVFDNWDFRDQLQVRNLGCFEESSSSSESIESLNTVLEVIKGVHSCFKTVSQIDDGKSPRMMESISTVERKEYDIHSLDIKDDSDGTEKKMLEIQSIAIRDSENQESGASIITRADRCPDIKSDGLNMSCDVNNELNNHDMLCKVSSADEDSLFDLGESSSSEDTLNISDSSANESTVDMVIEENWSIDGEMISLGAEQVVINNDRNAFDKPTVFDTEEHVNGHRTSSPREQIDASSDDVAGMIHTKSCVYESSPDKIVDNEEMLKEVPIDKSVTICDDKIENGGVTPCSSVSDSNELLLNQFAEISKNISELEDLLIAASRETSVLPSNVSRDVVDGTLSNVVFDTPLSNFVKSKQFAKDIVLSFNDRYRHSIINDEPREINREAILADIALQIVIALSLHSNRRCFNKELPSLLKKFPRRLLECIDVLLSHITDAKDLVDEGAVCDHHVPTLCLLQFFRLLKTAMASNPPSVYDSQLQEMQNMHEGFQPVCDLWCQLSMVHLAGVILRSIDQPEIFPAVLSNDAVGSGTFTYLLPLARHPFHCFQVLRASYKLVPSGEICSIPGIGSTFETSSCSVLVEYLKKAVQELFEGRLWCPPSETSVIPVGHFDHAHLLQGKQALKALQEDVATIRRLSRIENTNNLNLKVMLLSGTTCLCFSDKVQLRLAHYFLIVCILIKMKYCPCHILIFVDQTLNLMASTVLRGQL